MENDQLKNLWQDYNKKMDSVEKTNRRILEKMISRKTEARFFRMKIQGLVGIITIPVFIVMIIIPHLKEQGITIINGTGAVLLSLVFLYYFIQEIRLFSKVLAIQPARESVILTQKKVLRYSQVVLSLRKMRKFEYPLLVLGFSALFWNNLPFAPFVKILLLGSWGVAVYFWGNFKYKMYFTNRIKSIDSDLNELKELTV